jgi:hypothetical protein
MDQQYDPNPHPRPHVWAWEEFTSHVIPPYIPYVFNKVMCGQGGMIRYEVSTDSLILYLEVGEDQVSECPSLDPYLGGEVWVVFKMRDEVAS